MVFNNDLEDLINGLYRPSVFYVPQLFTENFTEEGKQDLLDLGLFDAVIILKQDGKLETFKSTLASTLLIGKDSILNNNFFQLLKFRDNLANDSFYFIKNEYLRHVEASVILYTWLLDHIGIETECVNETQKVWFEFQKNAAVQHCEKIKAKFTPLEAMKRIDFSKMDITIPNPFKEKRFSSILKTSVDNIRKTTSAPRTKSYKISNQEADEYLLETVFNVKL